MGNLFFTPDYSKKHSKENPLVDIKFKYPIPYCGVEIEPEINLKILCAINFSWERFRKKKI
jgi:hypothetical protein